MFIILLKFSTNKANAPEFMAAHNAWIKQGFDENIFLMVGSIKPQKGGAILAHNCTKEEIETRVNADPFVSQNIVQAEIIEIAPAKSSEAMSFLMAS